MGAYDYLFEKTAALNAGTFKNMAGKAKGAIKAFGSKAGNFVDDVTGKTLRNAKSQMSYIETFDDLVGKGLSNADAKKQLRPWLEKAFSAGGPEAYNKAMAPGKIFDRFGRNTPHSKRIELAQQATKKARTQALVGTAAVGGITAGGILGANALKKKPTKQELDGL